MGDYEIHQGQIQLLTGCLSTQAFNFDIFFEISQ